MVKGRGKAYAQDYAKAAKAADAGVLALTMYEDLPEAQTVLNRVNASLKPLPEYLNKTDGGRAEGLVYG